MKPVSVYPTGRARSKNPISPAIRYKDLLFTSGQIGRLPDGTIPVGIREQSKATLDNLAAVLEAAGGTLANVVRCTCYVTSIADFPAFNEVYRDYFTSEPLPARTTAEVSKLGGADLLVEVDAIAVVPE